MTQETRLLAIGLDAAEQSLIRRWMDSGELPTLAGLRERAVWGRTTNEPGLYAGAVWPTIFTGVSAARHGCYYYRQICNGTYRTAHFHPDDLKYPPFWKAISDAGCRVAIVDVPKSMLTAGLNGIQVVDWGLHDPSLPSVRCWPPALAEELTRRFGVDPVGQCDAADRSPAQYQDLRDRLIARIDRKRSLIEHFLQQGGWDLFLAVFGDSHCAGHQFWHLHEPEDGQQEATGLGDPLKDIYIALDSAIGQLIDQVDSDTTVMVFTSHGFGPHYDATALLDEILRRLEGTPNIHWPKVTQSVRSIYRSFLPVDLRTRLRPLAAKVFDSVERIDDLSVAHDRQARKCFMLPSNDNCGNIRVNLVGREPQGRIRPGEEFDAFCASLARDLLEIVNLETGQPVVKEVLKTADHYSGNHLHDLPDIIVRYHRGSRIRRVHSTKIGNIEGESLSCRSGDHRPEGLFFVSGPGLRSDHLNQTISAMDLAPTMAALLGIELPDVDGEPIAALLPNTSEATITDV
jgi:predicted AlkP superfamily phosphohydrolase/phosphomutase